MREGWKRYKIEELGRIITGKTPSTQNPENFGTKYPFITPKDMVGRKRIFQTERYLSEEGKNAVKNCLLPPNSVCVSCIGSDMGKVVMTTKSSVTNQQLNSVVCSHMFDSDFVYYAVTNISESLKNAGHHSTAVPILNKSDFSNFEIDAPDLLTQRRIAAILSALDDKIELNRQTNQTLEAIVQAIFKEWFVDFRFPGATGEMQDSELGPIPKGWRVGKLGEVLKIEIGGDWGADEEFEESISAISLRGTDLEKLKSTGFASDAPIRWIKKSSLEKRKLGNVNLLIGGSGLGPIGRSLYCDNNLFEIYDVPVIYSNFCKRLSADNPAMAAFAERVIEGLYNSGEMRQYFTGTSIPNLDTQSLLGYKIIIPEYSMINEYFEIALKSKYCKLFSKESATLAAIRDTLLPKLMNGDEV